MKRCRSAGYWLRGGLGPIVGAVKHLLPQPLGVALVVEKDSIAVDLVRPHRPAGFGGAAAVLADPVALAIPFAWP